ncbi:5704_t:CDS:2, partial [Gigaspora margarita]
ANDALNAAAEAITALANAMGKGEFEYTAKANHWSPACQLELA